MNHSLRARSAHDVGESWTSADATELYEIARWGQGYFAIGDNGQVTIHPTKEPSRSIDLKQLVDDLERRGISLPTLIRFSDVLQHRLKDIADAFQRAMAQHEHRRGGELRLPVDHDRDFQRRHERPRHGHDRVELITVARADLHLPHLRRLALERARDEVVQERSRDGDVRRDACAGDVLECRGLKMREKFGNERVQSSIMLP